MKVDVHLANGPASRLPDDILPSYCVGLILLEICGSAAAAALLARRPMGNSFAAEISRIRRMRPMPEPAPATSAGRRLPTASRDTFLRRMLLQCSNGTLCLRVRPYGLPALASLRAERSPFLKRMNTRTWKVGSFRVEEPRNGLGLGQGASHGGYRCRLGKTGEDGAGTGWTAVSRWVAGSWRDKFRMVLGPRRTARCA